MFFYRLRFTDKKTYQDWMIKQGLASMVEDDNLGGGKDRPLVFRLVPHISAVEIGPIVQDPGKTDPRDGSVAVKNPPIVDTAFHVDLRSSRELNFSMSIKEVRETVVDRLKVARGIGDTVDGVTLVYPNTNRHEWC